MMAETRLSRFQCNINVSFSSSHNRVGISMCIHDANGCFVLVKTTLFAPLCSMDVCEALGHCQALQWVDELGFDNTNFNNKEYGSQTQDVSKKDD